LPTTNGEIFSLTPALSRCERENRFRLFGEMKVVSGSKDFQLE
jgi:hypothetical protein